MNVCDVKMLKNCWQGGRITLFPICDQIFENIKIELKFSQPALRPSNFLRCVLFAKVLVFLEPSGLHNSLITMFDIKLPATEDLVSWM